MIHECSPWVFCGGISNKQDGEIKCEPLELLPHCTPLKSVVENTNSLLIVGFGWPAMILKQPRQYQTTSN